MADPGSVAKPALSLYANLLNANSSNGATIASAPVTYQISSEEEEAAKKQQALAASLRFQPTKRPQLSAQKARAKAIASKLAALPKPATESSEQVSLPETSVTQVPRSSATEITSAADWINTAEDDEDVNAYYRSQRQNDRKKRKKNKQAAQVVHQDWDDIYDPTRPTNYEEYKNSEEKIREIRDWKDLLYRHRMNRQGSTESDSQSDQSRRPIYKNQFAPPPSFAPPIELEADNHPPPPPDDEYIPPAPGFLQDDATGEDAFARRMRMSGVVQSQTEQPDPPPTAQKANTVPSAGGQITRAPVRYNLPTAAPELPTTNLEPADLQEEQLPIDRSDDGPRSNRPGQMKFAERLMAKYGWSKGQGLGKEGTGVTSALYAKVDKRKKKSDAEGGGYVQPTATGKILGGNKSAAAKEAELGKFGAMSEVVRLEGMLQGLDLRSELSGGIMQEIGEECSDKYGNVERVYIHLKSDTDSSVFVHFTNQLSALRAVNALAGRVFNGNEIRARFWDLERFQRAEYE